MPAIDSFGLPALETVLASAASVMNSLYLPAATPASVAAGLVAVPCLLAMVWLVRRVANRARAGQDRANPVDELHGRLEAMELVLADALSDASQLRQRVDALTSRHESLSAGNTRSGLRQAIALSKHGATTRQLVDTCSLSQGEAHLIQSLYGRPPGDGLPGEVH